MLHSINSIINKPVFKFVPWKIFGFIVAFSFIINMLTLAIPIFSLQIYDRVLTGRSVDTLISLIIGVVIALFISALIDLIRGHTLIRIANNIDVNLNPKMIEACINLSTYTGKKTAQPMRDVLQFKNFMAGSYGLMTLLDAPWVPVFFVVVWLIHPMLVVVMLISSAMLLTNNLLTEFLSRKRLKKANEINIEAGQIADEIMRNSDAVIAMGMKSSILDHWYSKYSEAAYIQSECSHIVGYLSSFSKFIRFMQNVAMTGVGAYLAINNEITIGSMIAANIMSSKGTAPLEGLINSWKNYVNTKSAADRLNEVYQNFYKESSKTKLPVPTGHVVVDKAVYVPDGTILPIIKGISFEILPGKTIGILGASGAGKSTLAKVLTGVCNLKSGSIKLDEADINNVWDKEDFGQYVGYLPQEISLFAGTVRENISRFMECSDESIIAAAIDSDAHKMILDLPNGYDTVLAAGGGNLSGGQRQRIGLARALYGDPMFIVLDEPNAFLDAEGERALVRAMMKAKERGATVVVITHKPSLLISADSLAIIANGQLQAYGPKEDIVKLISNESSNQMNERVK